MSRKISILMLAKSGFFARIFRRLFRMIEKSWHMYPLGFLFGLGFDTATEIGLLGISAAEASNGLPIWSILVFPALFTAGMTLIDTTDSVADGRRLWLGLRQADPQALLQHDHHVRFGRRRRVIGGVEALGLIAGKFGISRVGLSGTRSAALNENLGLVGYLIVGVFILMLGCCRYLFYRHQRLR